MPEQTEHRQPLELDSVRTRAQRYRLLADSSGDRIGPAETAAAIAVAEDMLAVLDTVEILVRQVTRLEHRYEDRRDELARARERLAMATRFSVSVLPEGHVHRRVFEIAVERRAPGQWAVCWLGECLRVDGRWSYEPIPSERDDGWKAAHRFDLETALRLASEQAPGLVVNGVTARQAADRAAAGGGAGNPTTEDQPPPTPDQTEVDR